LIGVAGVSTVAVMSASTTGAPFSKSLSNALPTFGSPVVPFVGPNGSSFATIAGGTTVTVITASSQLLGFRFSQIW
jgi:hypothetical protein